MTRLAEKPHPAAEPWMRNTHTELDPLRRGVVHALELTLEDVDRWVTGLDERDLESRPDSLPGIAFHLRHIARSLDRLLTYAEGRALNGEQLARLSSEHEPGIISETLEEFRRGVGDAISRTHRFSVADLIAPRGIGRQQLPTTVGALLVHCAEHTQRHSGQLVTTAKIVRFRAAP